MQIELSKQELTLISDALEYLFTDAWDEPATARAISSLIDKIGNCLEPLGCPNDKVGG